MLDVQSDTAKAESFGLQFGAHPCIVFTYTLQGKLRVRRIRPHIATDMTTARLVASVVEALPPSLDASTVSRTQVARVAHALLQRCKADIEVHEQPPIGNRLAGQLGIGIDCERDYNKVRAQSIGQMLLSLIHPSAGRLSCSLVRCVHALVACKHIHAAPACAPRMRR